MIITAYDDYVNEAGCSVNLLELVSTYRNKKSAHKVSDTL